MGFLISYTLKRSYLRCFHEYMKPTYLLTSCSLEHQLSSVKYFATNAAHLLSVSKFQVLRKRQSDFLSPVPLKTQLSLHFWKPLSSASRQVLSKDNSKVQENKPVAFTDSDICLLFDAPGILISQLTFAEVKAVANKKKCRPVYMHKNSDGIHCFQLQALRNVKTSTASNITSQRNALLSAPKKKPQKNEVKELRIQATVGDHDLSIKINKMEALLAKGKQLKVVIITSSSQAKSGKGAAVFIKHFTEKLGDVCQIKQAYSSDKETCLNMTPKEAADKKKMADKQKTADQEETANQKEVADKKEDADKKETIIV